MSNLIYLNGGFIPQDRAKISVLDRGFLYGDGLFETMRAYEGKVFRIRQHWDRLFRSARIIGLKIPAARKELTAAAHELLKRNSLADAYLRLTVSRGTGPPGLEPSVKHQPTLAMVARELSTPSPTLYRRGYRATILPPTICPDSPLPRIKSINYLGNILAKREAKRARANEGIMQNSRGLVTEGTVSNIFIVRRGRLITPNLECGVLPGITRAAVLELAAQLGIPAREGEIRPAQLLSADECFLTNSIIEIMPVTRIDGQPIGDGNPGPITAQLQEAYRNLVRRKS